jgi:hypothetical protein
VLKEDTPTVAEVTALVTKAHVASCVVAVPATAVGAVGVPVNVGEAEGAPPTDSTSESCSVTAPVLPFHEITLPARRLPTNWVVASADERSLATGVGAVGTPVKAGLALGAPPAVVMSLVASVTAPVLPLKDCTIGLATIACLTKAVVAIVVDESVPAGVGAVGVPENAGDAKSAPPAPEMSLFNSVTAPERVLKVVTPAVAEPPEVKETMPVNVALALPEAGSKS